MRDLRLHFLPAALCGCTASIDSMTSNPAMSHAIPTAPTRIIQVELLALDLDTCTRCTGTERNLDEAVADAGSLFREAGAELRVTRHIVKTRADAERLRLVASPTIRIDGRDIAPSLMESDCKDCNDLAGCSSGIDCRVWTWRGRESLEAPRAMILDALLSAYAAPSDARLSDTTEYTTTEYTLPAHLARFFDATETDTAHATSGDCCDRSTCCDASRKDECCGSEGPAGTAPQSTERCGCK